jgi:hypothetical protein|nr:MAG TPA: hypothetical protein [Caudoviricetes sp.]
MQTIKLNPQILSEIFELISTLSEDQNKEFFNFQLKENSLTFQSYTSLTEDQTAEFDDTIANWMDHSSVPQLLYNFNWEASPEGNSFTFNW